MTGLTQEGEIKLKLGLRRWGLLYCVYVLHQHHIARNARRNHESQCSNLKPATAYQSFCLQSVPV